MREALFPLFGYTGVTVKKAPREVSRANMPSPNKIENTIKCAFDRDITHHLWRKKGKEKHGTKRVLPTLFMFDS